MSLVEHSLIKQHYGYNIPKNQVTVLRVQIYDKLALSYQVLRIKPFPNEDDPNYTSICVIKTKTWEN